MVRISDFEVDSDFIQNKGLKDVFDMVNSVKVPDSNICILIDSDSKQVMVMLLDDLDVFQEVIIDILVY